MLQEIVEVVTPGDARGNGMAIRTRLPSGLEVYGLATRNSYGGDWDYGPTWNYLVLGDEPFLLDTGRWGMGRPLVEMIESVGLAPRDLRSIVISHGHEDHDGGLSEVVAASGACVRAHPIYACLSLRYPEHAPPDYRAEFPAACWRCFMPESFTHDHCLEYQRRRSDLEVVPIDVGSPGIGPGVQTLHIPGHSPDSVAVLIGDEAILVGDVVLPQITPFPSQERQFEQLRPILHGRYQSAESLFGLRAYLRSLRALSDVARRLPNLLVLPGHRLFYDDRWHDLDLAVRVTELEHHHLQRCGDILEILSTGPKTAQDIAREHFEPGLLAGLGMGMATNEILSHCELLATAGDVAQLGDGRLEASGSSAYRAIIESLEPA